MKILYFGQLGLPRLSELERTSAERRVEILARQMAERGHEAIILGTAPYLRTGNHHGVTLISRSSLNPRKPGGWFYLISGLLSVWYHRPDTIHVHGWRAAAFGRVLRWIVPGSTLVWTVDYLPRRAASSRFIAWIARPFDAVTVPSRTLQYQILYSWNLRTTYIPDGFNHRMLPDVSLAHFGLRRRHYITVLASTPAAIREVLHGLKAAGIRKKVVVLHNETGAFKRLRRTYKNIAFLGDLQGRSRRSVLHGAALVILGDAATDTSIILEAMADETAIMATTAPHYQEVLGVAAKYWRAGDIKMLATEIKTLAASTAQRRLGRLAKTRAERHFTWNRATDDYASLYAVQRRLVPIDSVQRVRFTEKVLGTGVEPARL